MGGIVKSVKKVVSGVGDAARKIIPNELSDIAVKAAPFVAPFNPLLAGGMAAIGSYDQTGSFGRALKSGLMTYGGGQLGRYVGGAGFQTGYNPFGGLPSGSFGIGSLQLGSSPLGTKTGIGKLLSDKGFIGSDTATKQIAGDIYQEPGQVLASEGSISQAYTPPAPGTVIAGEGAVSIPGQIPGQTKAITPGYKDLFSQVLKGDLSQKTQAIKELGGKALKDIYTNPVTNPVTGETTNQIDKLAVGATIAGAASYMDAKRLAEEAELVEDADDYTEEMYEADKQRYLDYYSKVLTPEAFGIRAQQADGGRAGFKDGLSKNRVAQLLGLLESPNLDDDMRRMIQDEIDMLMGKFQSGGRVMKEDGDIVSMTDEGRSGVIYKDPSGESITKEQMFEMMDKDSEKQIMPKEKPEEMVLSGKMKQLEKVKDILEPDQYEMLLKQLKEESSNGIPSIKLSKKDQVEKELEEETPNAYPFMIGTSPITYLRKYLKGKEIENRAMGGRIGYAMGTEVPMRTNQGGITELDYRNSGGFVPVGIKEKADDVPAMLSKNEFVFTADAVRAAGGGSVNKGAQKMYNLMKSLENKVV